MAPKSWESFGGREDAQPGSNPQESVLLSWALQQGFVPVQAQATLCSNHVHLPSYRKRMLCAHYFRSGACQTYNVLVGKADQVTPLRVFLNPMHLLVQQAYLEDKVCGAILQTHWHSWLNLPALS